MRSNAPATPWPSSTAARSFVRARSRSSSWGRPSNCKLSALSDRAGALLEATTIGAHIQIVPDGLAITLPEGTEREVVAEVARVLVEGGIWLYRLQHIQASLETWFLQVTSRLGEASK